MKQTLSSKLTFIYKLFLPIMAILGTAFAIYKMVPSGKILVFILIPQSVFLIFFLYAFFKLKKVEVDDNFMYVSSFYNSESIPLSEIDKVKGNLWFLRGFVYVSFKNENVFGKRIWFLSKGLNNTYRAEPSAATELRTLVGKNR